MTTSNESNYFGLRQEVKKRSISKLGSLLITKGVNKKEAILDEKNKLLYKFDLYESH